jgi:hypothetical protein
MAVTKTKQPAMANKSKLENEVRSLRGQVRQDAKTGVGQDGTLRIRRHEFWKPVVGFGSGIVQKASFNPGDSGVPFLDNISRLYQCYKVHGMRVHYKPSVGSTEPGVVHMGVDFDTKREPVTDQGVLTLQPNGTSAVWKQTDIVVPPSRCMRSNWLYTAEGTPNRNEVAFELFYTSSGATTETHGEFWLTYDITLMSPRLNTAVTTPFKLELYTALVDWSGSVPADWLISSDQSSMSYAMKNSVGSNTNGWLLSLDSVSSNQKINWTRQPGYPLGPGIYHFMIQLSSGMTMSSDNISLDGTSSGIAQITDFQAISQSLIPARLGNNATTMVLFTAHVTAQFPKIVLNSSMFTDAGSTTLIGLTATLSDLFLGA